jgi:NDP-sugar pyrophosphorylase family protein
MRYAIIAAGEGSRLTQEGVALPKPLVEVGGESLIMRLLRIFMAHGATEICVICNDRTPLVEARLKEIQTAGISLSPSAEKTAVPLRFVVKSTPSSMHSFYELADWLDGDEPFVLTTVDTVFRETEFAEYLAAFKSCLAAGNDGLMGVTTYVDDEKPLYVETDRRQHITAFMDAVGGTTKRIETADEGSGTYVSAGIYGLTPKALQTLRTCVARGESRMRNFQRALLRDGLQLQAWAFSKVLDVDHQSDIAKAEEFLKE